MSGKHEIIEYQFFDDTLNECHEHDAVEFVCVLEGEVFIQTGESQVCVRAEDFFLINSGGSHHIAAEKGCLGVIFWINYQEILRLVKKSRITFRSQLEKGDMRNETIGAAIGQILVCHFDHSSNVNISRQSLYYELIYQLVDALQCSDGDRKMAAEEKEDRVADIKYYLASHYADRIGLNDLAEDLHVSPGYFSKYFKQHFKCGFLEYLTALRLKHCVEDIMETEQTMLQIALNNGFQSLSAFNNAFRNMYHMTPSAYRKVKKEEQREPKESQDSVDTRRIEKYLMQRHEVMKQKEDRIRLCVENEDGAGLNKNWNKMLNIGGMEQLLKSKTQEHVLKLKEFLGIQYVRIWNTLQGIVFYDEKGTLELNFIQLDQALDFLVKNGLKPYIALVYKPNRVNLTSDYMVLCDEKKEAVHNNIEEYEKIIYQYSRHLVNRYGIEELETWYFEIGKSEDVDFEKDFFEFYLQYHVKTFEIVYGELKRLSEKIQVGGCGFHMDFHLGRDEQILECWKKHQIRPDFLSIISFPYIAFEEEGNVVLKHSTERNFLKSKIKDAQKLFQKNGFAGIPIHIAEWSSTISQRNVLNDCCFKGAYLMNDLIGCLNQVEIIGYWTGSDVIGVHYDSKGILCGGGGLLTVDGICKPAFYGIDFMNHLQEYVIGKDEHSIVTSNRKGRYTIACHNKKRYSYKYYKLNENELKNQNVKTLFEDVTSKTLLYKIQSVKNGTYRIRISYLNSQNGSVRDEWVQLGEQEILSNGERQYLRDVCKPRMKIQVQKVENHILEFETTLLANEIQFIDIKYIYQGE